VRYEGYKEELYLAGFTPDADVVGRLGLDPDRVVAVLRPPPQGALYHRSANPRFEEILEALTAEAQVQVVLLPRTADQQHRYGALNDVLVPSGPVDGLSLLAGADLTVGAGGTMNRESALIGTPTYTIFAGRLSAVDTALVREGRMVDLRDHRGLPPLVKKDTQGRPERVGQGRARAILETVVQTVVDLAGERRRSGT
jgi:hypothetical protein